MPSPRLAAHYADLAAYYANTSAGNGRPDLAAWANSLALRANAGGAIDDERAVDQLGVAALRTAADGDAETAHRLVAVAQAHWDRMPEAREKPEALVHLAVIPGAPKPDMAGKAALDERVAEIGKARWLAYVNSRIPADIPVDGLRATQTTVRLPEVVAFVLEPDRVPAEHRNDAGFFDDAPLVIARSGSRWIYDGHHRATAAIVRGEKTIRARVMAIG